MAFVHLPFKLTLQSRAEIIEAWNVLRERGRVPHDANYAIELWRGKWMVAIWIGDRFHPQGGVAMTDPRELLAAAHAEPVINNSRYNQ